MSKPQRGLGQGLGALLGELPDADSLRKPIEYVNREISGPAPAAGAGVSRIEAGLIEPNPFQPRAAFDRDSLEELAASIRTLGLIQPITVRRLKGGKYQIISGERRFRACRIAGMDLIPAYIREADDEGMLAMAIVENVQRTDLDPIEVALGYQRLMEECHLTQEQMAEKVGKKRASIANSLRLLKLPAKIQHDLKVGLITTGHAKVLLELPSEADRTELARQCLKEDITVRTLERRVRERLSGPPRRPAAAKPDIPPDYRRLLLDKLSARFATSVRLEPSVTYANGRHGHGRIEIGFFDNEDLGRILGLLGIDVNE